MENGRTSFKGKLQSEATKHLIGTVMLGSEDHPDVARD